MFISLRAHDDYTETMLPGLKENPKMEGFFQSFSAMFKGLNEDEKYKDLRKIVQTGLGIKQIHLKVFAIT